MRVYLAAKYPRRDEMREVAVRLKEAGFQVTSRWLEETAPLDGGLHDGTPLSHMKTALQDIADIDHADMLLFFAEDSYVGIPRGGRHFECGFAYGRGKRIAIIGEPENNFHYLPRIIHYKDVDSFLEAEKP